MNLGLLRVRNEARWIERSVRSLLPVCESILVMDDHSEDETAAICAAIPGVTVLLSPFEGLDETRDKNWLLDQASAWHPDWIVFIDGDEVLDAPAALLAEMQRLETTCLSLRILYLWNDHETIRVDGVYGDFHRESVFRPNGSRFIANGTGTHFHCGNVPAGNRQGHRVIDVPILHFGYMHRADRERKFAWYNQHDPNNPTEDFYRHMVIGDLFPKESQFRHGGPLRLARRCITATT